MTANEFRCPQCRGTETIETGSTSAEVVRCKNCRWRGTWADVLAARQGDKPTLMPEFVAAAEIEAGTPIATVTGSTAMALEIDELKQQLAEAREQLAEHKDFCRVAAEKATKLDFELAAVTAERDKMTAVAIRFHEALEWCLGEFYEAIGEADDPPSVFVESGGDDIRVISIDEALGAIDAGQKGGA